MRIDEPMKQITILSLYMQGVFLRLFLHILYYKKSTLDNPYKANNLSTARLFNLCLKIGDRMMNKRN